MTDNKQPVDASKLSDDALRRISDTLNEERTRRGQTFSNVDWGRLSPADFEAEKNRVVAASERAAKAAEAERLRREAGGE